MNISEGGFNSTLVQLKDKFPELNYTDHQSFNSTLVQLKVGKIRLFKREVGSFNSTLVQLKVFQNRFVVYFFELVSILP